MRLKQKYGPFSKGEPIKFTAGSGRIAHIGFQYPHAVPTYLDLQSPHKTEYHDKVYADAKKKLKAGQKLNSEVPISYIQSSNASPHNPFVQYFDEKYTVEKESSTSTRIFEDYNHRATDSLISPIDCYNTDFVVSFSDNTEYGDRNFRIDRNCILEFDDLRANNITVTPQRDMPAETIIDVLIDDGEI